MSVRTGGRHILFHGLLLVLVGLLWGLAVPKAPHPRLALGAHVQFLTNGLLVIVLATLLLALPHRVGRRSMVVMVLAAWLIWPMALSEVANAWWGTSQMLPIAASQAGVTGGALWQESTITATHVVAGLGLIAAWILLLVGFARSAGDAPPDITR